MRAFRSLRVNEAGALACSAWYASRATFYDKIKDERDKSENDIESMFSEFPKNPHAQQVPTELHQVGRTVINRAEGLNYAFLGISVVGAAFVFYYVDPFRSDVSSRPDKSMAAQASAKYGDSVIR